MARNDSAAVSSKKLLGGTTIVILFALLVPDPTGLGSGTRGAGHYFVAEAIPFIEQSQRTKRQLLFPLLRSLRSLFSSFPYIYLPSSPLSINVLFSSLRHHPSPFSLQSRLSAAVKVPPLKELSKVWEIDIVNGGDCADMYNTQVVRECDKEGFIVSITYAPMPPMAPVPTPYPSFLYPSSLLPLLPLLRSALSLRLLPPPSPSALDLCLFPPPSPSPLYFRPLLPPSPSARSSRPLLPPAHPALSCRPLIPPSPSTPALRHASPTSLITQQGFSTIPDVITSLTRLTTL
ncbi:unnamed protein product [Closterium sp. NIES-64]|nr:unnamed protein product [Closterium sp. NIES-64]